MEWYSEGVANAITTCRQQNALFIVYIKGNVLEFCIIGWLHVTSRYDVILLLCGKLLPISMKMYIKFDTLSVYWMCTQR